MSSADAKNPSPRPTLGLALGAAGMLIFSATVPMTRVAVLEVPWDQTLAVRMALACAASLLLVFHMPRPGRAEIPALTGTLLGVVFGFPVLMTAAMQTAPAAHGAVVVGLLPLATAAASVIVNREHPPPLFWAASVAGAVLVGIFALRDGGAELVRADFLLFCAVVAAGIGYASGGRLAKTIGGIAAIVWTNALAAPLVLLYCVFFASGWEWDGATPKSIGAIVYLGLCSQLIGFFFWNRGLALGGISRVGQLLLLMPFLSIALAAVMIGENITAETPLFALAVAVCVFITMKTRSHPPAPTPTHSAHPTHSVHPSPASARQ